MRNDILVSIVVPIYNQENFLDISLPTLMRQTYKNIEIILVNDGSTDGSGRIIERYLQQDSRFKYLYKVNGGLVSATIAGVKKATGEYLAFLDPDDKIGLDYIENFIKELDNDYDFLAAGFFYDDGKIIKPYPLKEDKILKSTDIKKLQTNYLSESTNLTISNDIFVSRWNKLYKTLLIKEMVEEFQEFEAVSLGEDTIFTFLLLQRAQLGKTIAAANSYFYNVANPNSMMKDGAIETYVWKCHLALENFSKLLKSYGFSTQISYQLYYFLIFSFFHRLKATDQESFEKLYIILKNNSVFQTAMKKVYPFASKRQKLQILSIRFLSTGLQFLFVQRIGLICYVLLERGYASVKLIGEHIFNKSPRQIAYLLKFQKHRKEAFQDLAKYLPIIEERLQSDLLELQKDSENSSSINKNIFIFWWDGFSRAPEIVQICLSSVKRAYPDYQLHLIDKENYQRYTDIHPKILTDFEKGKISVQTFSDVLRFNLLKNNGGMWIDSTIYFSQRLDLFPDLERQSFSTIQFSTSRDFMTYKGEFCSWSGFLIASRRKGRLVTIVDKLFERYYLRYRTFSTYFFIDIILMLCKIYEIDDAVLSKIELTEGNMFQLAQVLNKPFNSGLIPYIERLPQKLFWNYQDNTLDNFYKYYKEKVRKMDE